MLKQEMGQEERSNQERRTIPIVFATDMNFVPYCGVAISSLIEHTLSQNDYDIYILYDMLPQNLIYRLTLMQQDHVHIKCVCIHEYVQHLQVTEFNHLSVATVYRLVIAKLLPQYEKVLYLDSDIIVLRDVAKLYDIDIGDNVLGAVHGFFDTEFFKVYTKNILRIKENSFFNAGILIINTKKFRDDNIGELCLDLLRNRTDLIYMDQCALNIVCEGKVQFIPREWNYEWNILFESTIDPKEYFCEDPYIIHYDGGRKPWNYVDQMYAEVFWEYARKTIFYEEILRWSSIKLVREATGIIVDGKMINSVAIYGAGAFGTNLIRKLHEFNAVKIVAWVDQKYKDIQSDFMPVSAVELLYTVEYDCILVAIENERVFEEIRNMLSKKGIPLEKIKKVTVDW